MIDFDITTCQQCKRSIEDSVIGEYQCIDSQCDYIPLNFCCESCMKKWATHKIVGMCIALIIGIVACLYYVIDEDPIALLLLFAPYMIRRLFRSSVMRLDHIKNNSGSSTGPGAIEVFGTIFLMIILSATIVYPVFKLIQEIILYAKVFKPEKKLYLEDEDYLKPSEEASSDYSSSAYPIDAKNSPSDDICYENEHIYSDRAIQTKPFGEAFPDSLPDDEHITLNTETQKTYDNELFSPIKNEPPRAENNNSSAKNAVPYLEEVNLLTEYLKNKKNGN